MAESDGLPGVFVLRRASVREAQVSWVFSPAPCNVSVAGGGVTGIVCLSDAEFKQDQLRTGAVRDLVQSYVASCGTAINPLVVAVVACVGGDAVGRALAQLQPSVVFLSATASEIDACVAHVSARSVALCVLLDNNVATTEALALPLVHTDWYGFHDVSDTFERHAAWQAVSLIAHSSTWTVDSIRRVLENGATAHCRLLASSRVHGAQEQAVHGLGTPESAARPVDAAHSSTASIIYWPDEGMSGVRYDDSETREPVWRKAPSVDDAVVALQKAAGRAVPRQVALTLACLTNMDLSELARQGHSIQQGYATDSIVRVLEAKTCVPFFCAETSVGDILVCVGGARVRPVMSKGGLLNVACDSVRIKELPGAPERHHRDIMKMGISRDAKVGRPCVLVPDGRLVSPSGDVLVFTPVAHGAEVDGLATLPEHYNGRKVIGMIDVHTATRVAAHVVRHGDADLVLFRDYVEPVRGFLSRGDLPNGEMMCEYPGARKGDLGSLVFARVPAGLARDGEGERWCPLAYMRDFSRGGAVACALLSTLFLQTLVDPDVRTEVTAGRARLRYTGRSCFQGAGND